MDEFKYDDKRRFTVPGPPKNKRPRLEDTLASDESLKGCFSQEAEVLDRETMRKMLRSDVLLSGLGGLGVEVAKNLVLLGVESVTLHDHSSCTTLDLSSQYFLTGDDVGSNRAEACRDRLTQLNPRVTTTTYSGELTEEFVKSFSAVVLTNNSLEEQLRINYVTHANSIPLIVGDTKGLFGQVFCDFGESFEVGDTNGEICSTGYVADVTRDSDGIVTCFQTSRVDLADGDFVTFNGVEGMFELNGCAPKQIRVVSRSQFSIGDTRNYSDYVRGGVVKQVKMPRTFNFQPLAHALEHPQFVVTDSGKPEHPQQLHLAFLTLHRFHQNYGRGPRPWNVEDAERFVNIATSTCRDQGDEIVLNTELFELFSKVCSGSVCPINSIIGGIVAQEVVIACSSKLSPIVQWLYFDAVECIPKSIEIQEEDSQPIDNRYDGQVAVFGREFQNRLGNLNYLVVGAGTIGCELLKNISVMGIGEINHGQILVADDGTVRRSDLSSQFLYRLQDLECSKAVAAANAIRMINQNTNIIPTERKVCQDMENMLDDKYFENIDGVVVQGSLNTRKNIDRKCVYHHKPLLDCGISGTKGSTQVMVPMLTQTYQCSRDLPEIKVLERPQIHPITTEDVLYWARNNFEILFNQSAENVQKFMVNNLFTKVNISSEQTVELLETVCNMLINKKPRNFEDCLFWARKIWKTQYVDQIRKLLLKFPPDAMTQSGEPFWSPPKKCPVALNFSVDDPLNLNYITATANLIAKLFDITQNHNKVYIKETVQNAIELRLLEFDDVSTLDTTCRKVSHHDRISKLLFDLPSKEQLKDLTITAIEFDPNDDSNFHMDFIMAAANLRAANFGIEPADRSTGQLIVGDVTPTLVTTASVVAGLAALELIKLTQGITDNDVSGLKNGFINLGLPFLEFAQPLPPTQHTYNDTRWTVWDRFEIQGELSLEQFLHYFLNRGLRVNMVHCGPCVLYSELFPLRRLQEIRKLKMSQVIRKMSGKPLKTNVRILILHILCIDLGGYDVEVPFVRYVMPSQVEKY